MELGSDRARLSSISTASRAKGRDPGAVARGPATSRKATPPDGARSEENESYEGGGLKIKTSRTGSLGASQPVGPPRQTPLPYCGRQPSKVRWITTASIMRESA